MIGAFLFVKLSNKATFENQNYQKMKVYILTIGDEILIGQIVDTNSAWMGQQLNKVGASVVGITTLSDEREVILGGLELALSKADIVLITGGLGPTKDDITKKTIADYFGDEMVFHEETYQRIVKIFERFGRDTTPAHKEQSYMPSNATILNNNMGTAPGMWFDTNGKVVVSMPGVPREMKYLMEYEVIPKLINQFQSIPFLHRTLLTIGEGESRIARRIEPFVENLPSNIKIAYLPGLGQVRLRLSGTGPDEAALKQQLDRYMSEMAEIVAEFAFGYDEDNIQSVVGRLLKEKGLTLSTAESCTGGYVAHMITGIPGSSAYFKGSVVAYDNAVKVNQLKVQSETLEAHGAVSEETVKEMAKGCLELLETDIAVAISGIAGPGGGTEEKPVGTIWMAIADKNSVKTHMLKLGKDRLTNIQYTGVRAVNMVRKFVLEK